MRFCMREAVPGLQERIVDLTEVGQLTKLDKEASENDTSFILSCNVATLVELQKENNLLYNTLKALNKKYAGRIKLRFAYRWKMQGFLNKLKSDGIAYFFSNFVIDYDMLNWFIECGVSDVYISGTLGFDIQKVAEKAHAAHVAVRVYPNFCQSNVLDRCDTLTQFYIRPEDIQFYDKFIDVCEIFETEKLNAKVIYKVYAKDKKWWGNLNEIIIGLKSDIDNRYIGPEFAWFRSACRKSCAREGICHMCKSVEELSHIAAKVKEEK